MAPLRSLLYFPANSVRMIVKAATLPTDAVIFDLEDAVSLDDKENARGIARDYIGLIKKRGIQTFVRVNSLTTGLTAEDIESIAVKELDGVMLAKTETESDVAKLSKMLDRVEKSERLASKSIKLIPLIESAKGVVNSLQIVSSNRRVIAVAFGAGDYYKDIGRDVSQISNDQVELLYARSTIVNTGRSVGIQALDTPFLGSMADREAFLGEVRIAVQLGFKGKQCIHPSQINTINTLFSPLQNEIDHAGRIVKAFEEAQAGGLGAISFEGKMIDNMTYRQAKDTLAAAEQITAKTMRDTYVSISEIFAAQQR